jgi:hypothetical protein
MDNEKVKKRKDRKKKLMAFMQIDVNKKYEMIIAVIKNEMYMKNYLQF